MKLIDTPESPEIYKAEMGAGLAILKTLRGESMLEWSLRKLHCAISKSNGHCRVTF